MDLWINESMNGEMNEWKASFCFTAHKREGI